MGSITSTISPSLPINPHCRLIHQQWGYGKTGSNTQFPISFHGEVKNLTAIHYGTDTSVNIIVLGGSISSTSAIFKTNFTNNEANVFWFAIG